MTQKNIIQIPRTLVNELLHLAQQTPAQPICGLIGKRGDRCMCYPVENAAIDSSVLFALNATEQLSAIEAIKSRGQELFAVYHSHPHEPALPTADDLQDVSYPDALYLIISLNTKGVLEMRGFYIHQQQIEEVDLII